MWTIVIFSSMGSGVVKSLICKWGIEFGWEGVGVGTTVPYLGVLILTGFSLLFWYLTRVYKVPRHPYIIFYGSIKNLFIMILQNGDRFSFGFHFIILVYYL